MSLIALHSPSCAYYKGDFYVAFYAGEQECVNQRVLIFKKEKSKYSLFKQLPIGSGNPVLMTFNDSLYCCYSMFTRPMINNVFDLWRTTYTCVQDLMSEKDSKYVLSTYCCPRVNPYYLSDNSLLLPCYDEGIQRGMLFGFGKGRFMERYVCMDNKPVIQPTVVSMNDKYFCLFRNFQKSLSFYPQECYTPYAEIAFSPAQQTVIFGELKKSTIPNHNESIATLNDREGNPLVVFNAEKNRQRLTLGMLDFDKEGRMMAKPMAVLNETERGSYPNCCFNKKNQLVVVFTAYDKGINSGSSICVATISTKYDRVLSRKYIAPETIKDIK